MEGQTCFNKQITILPGGFIQEANTLKRKGKVLSWVLKTKREIRQNPGALQGPTQPDL